MCLFDIRLCMSVLFIKVNLQVVISRCIFVLCCSKIFSHNISANLYVPEITFNLTTVWGISYSSQSLDMWLWNVKADPEIANGTGPLGIHHIATYSNWWRPLKVQVVKTMARNAKAAGRLKSKVFQLYYFYLHFLPVQSAFNANFHVLKVFACMCTCCC